MDPTAAPRTEPIDPPAVAPRTARTRLPVGAAAAVIALLSGGLWVGLVWVLRALL